MGGINREGAYFKFCLRGEGLIRKGGLIERGLYRAFTVCTPSATSVSNVEFKGDLKRKFLLIKISSNVE